jgi:putative nucleotidyltransferase with HDIG domain
MRRVLFVDDEVRVLDGLRRMLHSRRDVWEMQFAAGGPAALEALEQKSVDVVITDMRMPGMDGAALLAKVARRWPRTIRVVLSGQTDDEAAVRAMPFAHQYLMKPCELESLAQVVDRTTALRDLLSQPALQEIAGQVESLPAVPGVYLALGEALASASASINEIAGIIERDPALAAKVLQLVNSSFFGQRREVCSVGQACALLGTGLIRNLALAHDVFSSETWGAGHSLSLEAEGAHAVAVAGIARSMQPDTASAEAAVAAGLLHDIGKLILALSHLPAGAEAATPDPAAPGSVTHAEVGAYLLGLWGLPHLVVEAVAHHHAPSRVGTSVGSVLAAVHLADALVHEAHGESVPAYDPACLAAIVGDRGVEGLDRWREMARASVR